MLVCYFILLERAPIIKNNSSYILSRAKLGTLFALPWDTLYHDHISKDVIFFVGPVLFSQNIYIILLSSNSKTDIAIPFGFTQKLNFLHIFFENTKSFLVLSKIGVIFVMGSHEFFKSMMTLQFFQVPDAFWKMKKNEKSHFKSLFNKQKSSDFYPLSDGLQ